MDAVTLQTACRGIWIVIAAGDLFDPDWARRQVEGALIQALGRASMEHLSYEKGRVRERAYSEYQMPGIQDVPPLSVTFIGGSASPSVREAKAFESLPFMGFTPAFAAAVSQATGLYLDRIPLTPEVIQECL